MNDFESAESFVLEMQRVVKENASRASAQSHKTGLANYQYIMRVAKGDYEGVDTFYQILVENFETVGSMLDRVAWSWRLGELYVKLNRPEKARVYLEFVVQNGNTTCYVARAQSLLNNGL